MSQKKLNLSSSIFGVLVFIVYFLSLTSNKALHILYPVNKTYEFNYLKRELGILELSQLVFLFVLLYFLNKDFKLNNEKNGFQRFWLINITVLIPFLILEETDFFMNFYDFFFGEKVSLFGFRNFHNSNHFWVDILIYYIVVINLIMIYLSLKSKKNIFLLNYRFTYLTIIFIHLSIVIISYIVFDMNSSHLLIEKIDDFEEIQIFTETMELSMYFWWLILYLDQRR